MKFLAAIAIMFAATVANAQACFDANGNRVPCNGVGASASTVTYAPANTYRSSLTYQTAQPVRNAGRAAVRVVTAPARVLFPRARARAQYRRSVRYDARYGSAACPNCGGVKSTSYGSTGSVQASYAPQSYGSTGGSYSASYGSTGASASTSAGSSGR